MSDALRQAIADHRAALDRVEAELADGIDRAAELIAGTIRSGGKLLLLGNGGSAADSQHIAAELTGRYRRERAGFAALALTTDTSALTSIANDYGYEHVFERQVEALARPGDVVVAISTSGNSRNVVRAVQKARSIGCAVIGWLGRDGGVLAPLCDIPLTVPVDDTARIQEMHILIGHVLCDQVEQALS